MNTSRQATVYETTYRKKRRGMIYRSLFIRYADGSGEHLLIPTTTHERNVKK